MDEKKTRTVRTVEDYAVNVLGKIEDLEKVADILKNENSSEADKIKAISKYFTVTSNDYSWSYHTFVESLGEEI